MKLVYTFLICVVLYSCKSEVESSLNSPASTTSKEYALVLHGGAGTIRKDLLSKEKEEGITKVLDEALMIGEQVLKSGGSSLDAVEKVINHLEDSPYFNAGKGAVFTHDGTNELDASIMTGYDMNAGAVGGVTNVKNPISAARAVLEKSNHVMMVGKGAEEFARLQGAEIVDPSYFSTEERKKSLEKMLKRDKVEKHGTVGCVALDKNGNITAGTSTGGMTNKKYNRIGDSPIIGAGTYANEHCGISCTGHGEYFIRYTVARDIAALVEYKDMSLEDAANLVINDELVKVGGAGGIIALDKHGNISMPFNTSGMYRGYIVPGEKVIKIYK